jgi:dihydrodipicolinate synthase/N-acetylneuraminate lyase
MSASIDSGVTGSHAPARPAARRAARYAPVLLATCPIPWTATGGFVEPLFRRTVRRLRRDLGEYLYIFGTAGEGYAVSDTQFAQIARIFRDEMAAESHAMLGIISLSLPTIIERIALGRELGFREFQLSLPAWGALNDRELDLFFRETCGRFPDCLFLHYNLARSRRVLCGDDYARLVRAHPNLVAVKMGGDDIAALADITIKAPELQCFFTDFGYALMRDEHECGLLAALVTISPARARQYHLARGPELAAHRDELRQIHRALKLAVGDEAHMDGAYDKMFIKLHDPDFPLRLLPPYVSASDAAFEKFRAAIPEDWKM